jgi:hypothetical protein
LTVPSIELGKQQANEQERFFYVRSEFTAEFFLTFIVQLADQYRGKIAHNIL